MVSFLHFKLYLSVKNIIWEQVEQLWLITLGCEAGEKLISAHQQQLRRPRSCC